MDYDVALRLEKRKADRSKRFHCKTSRFCFLRQAFQGITQNLFHICLTFWKNNVIQSFSFRLYEIIIDYLFKVS